MPVDVENIVMKVFAEFSCSAKKREDLKECFDFFESEYIEVIRHVPTRWLSLFKALDRMLSSWGPLKRYFIERGSDNCPTALWAILSDKENEISAYKEKWYPFENQNYKTFSCLNLECGRLPTLDQLLELWSISPWKQQTPPEQIYDELAALQSVFPSLKLEGNSIEMWCKFFQKEEAPNLLKIVQFVCSVPVSNAFVERIFSVMGNVWTDERNRLV
ncbi:dimer_Tnp_hAT domain-containing protein [Trichonephila clavipes]|nr:dimer_Tnp_hAT domain-containing protein [Trichonephila clavipes]